MLIPAGKKDKKAVDEPELKENIDAARVFFLGPLGGVGAITPTQLVPLALERHASP